MIQWHPVTMVAPPMKKGVIFLIKKGEHFNVTSGHFDIEDVDNNFYYYNLQLKKFKPIPKDWTVTHWGHPIMPYHES